MPWWAAAPTAHPLRTLLIAGVLLAISIALVTRLRPDASLEQMFPQRHPSARAMARITAAFHATDNLLLVATVADPSQQGRLTAFAEQLRTEIEGHEELRSMVRSVVYRPSPQMRQFMQDRMAPAMLRYLDDADLRELAHRISREGIAEQLQRAEARIAAGGMAGPAVKLFTQDPLQLSALLLPHVRPGGAMASLDEGPFFSVDGRSLLIEIRGTRPASDMDYVSRWMPEMRSVVQSIAPADVQVQYAGAYAIAEVAQREIRADMIASVIGSIVLLHVLFLLTYRKIASFPLAFAPVAAGITGALAMAVLLQVRLSPPIAVLGAILAGLGVDYALHYLSHYFAAGEARDATVVSNEIAPPLLAACVTSVIAFGALLLADVQALRDFGLIGLFGLGFSLLATLTILPAMLRLLPRRAKDERSLLRWHAEPLLRPVTAKPGRAIAFCLGIWAVLIVFVIAGERPGQWLEADLHALHPQPNEPLAVQETIAEQFSASPDPLLIHLKADDATGVLRLAHDVKQRMEAEPLQPILSGTYGPAHLLPNPRRQTAVATQIETLDGDAFARDFAAAVEASAFAPEAFEGYVQYVRDLLSLPVAPTLADLRSYDDLAERFLPAESADDAEAIMLLFLRAPLNTSQSRSDAVTAIRSQLDDLPGATLTGLAVVASDSEHAIFGDLARLFSLSAAGVAAWMLLYFRSVRDAAMALTPAAFGLTMIAAMISFAGFKLNMINLIAVPMILGLGVDDGIFLVTLARRQTDSSPLAERLAGAAHAIIMTSLTTMLAFGSLLLTGTPAIRSLGWFVGMGIGACLFASLALVAPALVRRAAAQESTR